MPSRDSGLPLVWSGYFTHPGGFGEESRTTVLALDRAGIQVHADPLVSGPWQTPLLHRDAARLEALMARQPAGEFVHVIHPWTSERYEAHPRARLTIGRAMFETDRIPAEWVEACAAMDQVWVPSGFNVDTFARSGVPREKLFRIPEGWDMRQYDPAVPAFEIPGLRDFVFLSVFGWGPRKGWDVLLRAYLQEFRRNEPVTLALKVIPHFGKTVEQRRAQVESFIRGELGIEPRYGAHVMFLDFDPGPAGLQRLYRAADAFVVPSRGEAWGRTYGEAMAMQLPVIATRWSGHLEFMNDENSYLIDCSLVEVPSEAADEFPWYPGHRWAEPDVEHLRRLMRHVYEERTEAREKGRRARRDIVNGFTDLHVAQAVIRRLDESGLPLQRKTAPVPLRMPSRRRLRVTWAGPQFEHFGMATVNRELCRDLLASGRIDLRIDCETQAASGAWTDPRFTAVACRARDDLPHGADVHVRHHWPPDFSPPESGRLVLVQPWEFGSPPVRWVEEIDAGIDEVWVPSTFVRDCYVAGGVDPARVFVVPNGVDPGRFRPGVAPLALSTKRSFRFLFVGGTIHRKGIDILLETYLQTFRRSDDVCLVVKDLGASSFYRGQNFSETIRRLQADPELPEVLYIPDDLPGEKLPRLYAACDALVHPYRGEGFGLPIAEAMACGLPVIVPDKGAALDFCNPSVALLVASERVELSEQRVGDLATVAKPWLLEVDRGRLAQAMRWVFEHRAEGRALGMRASEHIRAHFTWSKAAERVHARLEALANSPPRPRSPRPAALSRDLAAPASVAAKRLSVCMIVKDEENLLPRALASIKDLADELIVVDTGSNDRTVGIARSAGAVVSHYPWADDFASARNASLEGATGDWVLVFDADQELDSTGVAAVRRIVEADFESGFLVRQLNYLDDDSDDSPVESLTLRLFPNRPYLRFKGRVHEQLISTDPGRSLPVALSDVVVHHHGYRPAIWRRGKAERDIRALEQMSREEPYVPFHAYNLGISHLVLDRPAVAEAHFRRALMLSGPPDVGWPPYLVNALALMAQACLSQRKLAESIDACRDAIVLAPDFADAHFIMATALAEAARHEEALAAYQNALVCPLRPAYGPTDRSAAGWKALLGIGLSYLELGRREEAAAAVEAARRLAPGRPEVLKALVRVLGSRPSAGSLSSPLRSRRRHRARPGSARAAKN